MNYKSFIQFMVIFLVMGELMVRFDKGYHFLKPSNQFIATEVAITPTKIAVDKGSFKCDENQIRIMVIGDSYIYGGGIDPSEKFSRVLINELGIYNLCGKKIHILDLSKPSNNTLSNTEAFLSYFDIFKPHVTLWAYNFNDIIGNLAGNIKIKDAKSKEVKRNSFLWSVKKRFYRVSELLRFTSHHLQLRLKNYGIVLPFGNFYFLTRQAYRDGNSKWKRSRELFDSVIGTVQEHKSRLIVYKMPEFNLLEKNALFDQVDASLSDYFSLEVSITYIDGYSDFQHKNGPDFQLSKHDGHPNAKAHFIIARRVAENLSRLTLICP